MKNTLAYYSVVVITALKILIQAPEHSRKGWSVDKDQCHWADIYFTDRHLTDGF
jgi:hypothetical protein